MGTADVVTGVLLLLLLTVLVCGAISVLRQRLFYPARPDNWRYTFRHEHRAPRRALRAAQRRRKAVLRIHRRQRAAAEKKLKRISKAKQRRIGGLERKRVELLWPRRGEYVDGLGRLRLYEHELVVLTADPDDPDDPEEMDVIPLTELTVRHGSLPDDCSYIEITRRTGHTYAVDFQNHYDAWLVRDLQIAITNQIGNDREYWSRQRREAAYVDTDIIQAQADKEVAVKAARDERDALLRDQRTDPDLIQADNDWNTACDDWEALTGHRPRWPWWWRR